MPESSEFKYPISSFDQLPYEDYKNWTIDMFNSARFGVDDDPATASD